MGTRHITQVILDGKTVVSQYGQWDGYPDATGADILKFLNEMNRSKFETNLQACIPLTTEAAYALWEEAFIAVEQPRMKALHAELDDEAIELLFAEKLKKYRENGMGSMDVSKEFTKYHPTLQRDMGSDILQFIHDSAVPVEVQLDLDFINDSLMCEWAYVINLDNNVLEVYEDGNNLLRSFPLDNLPTETDFLQACKSKEQMEEEPEKVSSPTPNDVFNSVVIDLRTMASGNAPDDEMIKHMMNYIEANKDDFMEAVGI